MVRLHRLDDFFIDSILFQYFSAKFNMRTLNFMVNRFADIMEKRSLFRDFNIQPKFGCNHARNVCHFHGMRQHVLSKTCPEMKPAQKLKDFLRQIENADILSGLLSYFLSALRDFRFCFLNFFLDFRRLNPTILDELVESKAGDFSPIGIERRNNNGIRSFVDHKFNSGRLLKSADISPLPSDNFPLKLFVRQRKNRCRHFRHMRPRVSLKRRRNNLHRFSLNLILVFLINLLQKAGKIVRSFLPNLLKQFIFRFFR